jgi:hypothetical protein
LSGGDGAADGLLQPELHLNAQVAQTRPGGAELILDHLTNARSLLHDEQSLLAEVVERDLLAREAMPRGTGEYDLVAEERLEDDAAVAARRADDAQLELPVGHLVDHRLGV